MGLEKNYVKRNNPHPKRKSYLHVSICGRWRGPVTRHGPQDGKGCTEIMM